MKEYKCALVVGRFQPLHYGHLAMIAQARIAAEKVIILISSSQESGTTTNPFSYEQREKMIRDIYIKELYPNIIVKPVEDIGVGNNKDWGKHLLKVAGEKIDLFVTGPEERRNEWFGSDSNIKTIVIDKEMGYFKTGYNHEQVSGTRVRESILSGTEYWKANTPELLKDYYKELIPVLRKAKKKKTTSI